MKTPPRSAWAPAAFTLMSRLEEKLLIVHRAGTGNHPGTVAADVVLADPDVGVAGSELAVGELEGTRDPHHLGDPGRAGDDIAQRVGVDADDADHGTFVTAAQVGAETANLDLGDEVFDLRRGGVVPHHDDHGVALRLRAERR